MNTLVIATKLLTVSVTTAMMITSAIVIVTAFMSSSSSMPIQKASAQMMAQPSAAGRIGQGIMGHGITMNPGMMGPMMMRNQNFTGMMNPRMMMAAANAPNITGSVNLTTTIGNALTSQIKIGLSQATIPAEKAVGNNSHAISAHLGQANGYLVYTVWLVDSNYKFHKAIVDVANGKVLLNQQISMKVGPQSMGMMMDHGMMGGGFHP